MPSHKNLTEVRSSDLTPEQLESAGQFLALLGWKDNEASRKASRADIARIIAWYGALRYQSGFYRTASLEKPTPLIETTAQRPAHQATPPIHEQPAEIEFDLMDLTDLQVRPLVSKVG